jgi:hypothetical protein
LRKSIQPFFPFFDLPVELRSMIYDICLDNEKIKRTPDMKTFAFLYPPANSQQDEVGLNLAGGMGEENPRVETHFNVENARRSWKGPAR